MTPTQLQEIRERVAAAHRSQLTAVSVWYLQDIPDLLSHISALEAERDKWKTALEDIAMLDDADGHELTESHAFKAVAIATKTLGKHPSQIFAERFAKEHKPALAIGDGQ